MAVAVAAAAPVVLFSAAPALAVGPSAAQTQNQPTYAELEKAAADAKKAYEEAVIAKEEGQKELEATLAALDSDEHPLKAATIAADKAAKEAADAVAAAEEAVADAKAKLEAAESDAEKAAAQEALEAAEADLEKAVTAKKEAEAEAKEARTALDDARVEAVRKYSLVQDAPEKALEAKEAAEEALAAAKECVREDGLTSLAVGLPSKVVAGTTVDFTLRVTNGTERTLTVDPLVFFHADGESSSEKSRLKVEWSNGSDWQTLNGNEPEHIAHIDTMKPGGHSDVKMRMKVDSAAQAADAFALFASDAADAYNPCILGPMKRYDFELLPAGSDPGPVDDAEPGQPGKDDDTRPGAAKPGAGTGPSAQGGTSEQATAGGDLAKTGTSSATMPLALAATATVVLGAGAVLAVRRRRAADNN
ncbi:LPXTG cell wall anchor domain-containing protein [Streptomyces sp. PSKA54]|uniref:LPXTG cell wall anchor domain-containing protein n=1 Tax=Streptomyces himalayensis subsp. aureolus TaxID=2758039 RepID=A0A7W2HK24_9ACTN|nr:LPXTG cell wall anchor domain-containing protein [Streptomyces himalayensis subsp. aureolus]